MEWIIEHKKQILFAVMCVLLVIVIVMTGILIGRVGQLLQGFLGGNDTPAGTTTVPPQSSDTTPDTTVPPTSEPPATQAPTTVPTEPGHVHEYVLREQVAATCEHMGYDIMVCSGCGGQDIQNMVDSLGHDYGPGQTISPTCTEPGCTRSTCNRCGNVREQNVKDALGHDNVLVESVTAACGVAGYDKLVCNRCQEETLENEVPALEHEDVILQEAEATCTDDGVKQVQCSLCQRIEEEVTPATGHSFGDWITDDTGVYRVCTACGATEVKESAEPQPPVCQHLWGLWDLGSTGATRRCLTCNEEEILTLADMKIVNVTDMEVGGTRMISILIGTTEYPALWECGIMDSLNNGTLRYEWDTTQGLVVSYLDGNGETQTILRTLGATEDIIISVG